MYKPNYTITLQVLEDISEIAEIKATVERSKVLPLNEVKLKRQAMIRMAHTSTSIEGNRLAQFEVEKVLSGQQIVADNKSIREVTNYSDALSELDRWIKDNKIITTADILSLHKILMDGLVEGKKLGHFRPAAIYIVDDLGDGREKLRYSGPEAKRVPFLINELLTWLYSDESKTIHPILKAGIFHFQFVNIHPFVDGNGRLTRLLSSYILHTNGWDFRRILVLDDYYNRNQQTYKNSLAEISKERYHEGEDLTPWLEYFIKGFLVEARRVLEQIQSIGFGGVTSHGEQIFLDKDELKLMDFTNTTGRLTSSDAVDVLGIPKRTAQFKIKNLVNKGLIKTNGKGPSVYYTISRP